MKLKRTATWFLTFDREVSCELIDECGNVTGSASAAAYIHFTSFTINQYFLLGHVLNFNYYNGTPQLQVTVTSGGTLTAFVILLIFEIVAAAVILIVYFVSRKMNKSALQASMLK